MGRNAQRFIFMDARLMDIRLIRRDWSEEGIFGELVDTSGNLICYTLEHAFPQDGGKYEPKLPSGSYVCLIGTHRLDHNPAPFQAYEVTGVPGHTGILFHVGNYNADSDGCILLGTAIAGRDQSLTESRVAFSKFMTLQNGLNTFNLTVV
jgi:hypothetical protein